MRFTSNLRFFAVVVTLTGCGRDSDDDQGCAAGLPTDNLGCVERAADARPLVAGAQVMIYAPPSAEPAPDEAVTYAVSSDAPDVADVSESSISSRCAQMAVLVTAKQPGTTSIRFTPEGGSTTVVEVRVEAALRIGVTPFLDDVAQTIQARDDLRPPVRVDELAQITGGSMRWLVRYYGAADRELRGRGLVSLAAPAFATATLRQAEERELFELTTTAEGTGTLELTQGSSRLQLPVRSLPPAAIKTVRLYVQDDGADAGTTQLAALARGFDEADKPVYGAGITYALGDRQLGAADFVQYDLRPGAAAQLVATAGSVTATATVAADGTSNAKASLDTDLVNCSVGGGVNGLANFGLCAFAVALVLRRRVGAVAANGR